jgi:hypothetical protein
VTGQVLRFPRRQVAEIPLTYKALSHELGVSVRFLRYRFAEGMPSVGLDYAGRRVFLPSRCRAWLDGRQRRLGRESA